MLQVTDKHAQKDQSILWRMPLWFSEVGEIWTHWERSSSLGSRFNFGVWENQSAAAPFLCHLLYLWGLLLQTWVWARIQTVLMNVRKSHNPQSKAESWKPGVTEDFRTKQKTHTRLVNYRFIKSHIMRVGGQISLYFLEFQTSSRNIVFGNLIHPHPCVSDLKTIIPTCHVVKKLQPLIQV